MQRTLFTVGAISLVLGGALLGLFSHRPSAQAAPPAKSTAKPAATTMADLLSGSLYPNTLKRDELTPAYHFIGLIDAQGKPVVCATKGEMLALGGETFLIAYLLPDAPPKAATDAAAPLPDARLTLINMHYVQAMGGIRDTLPIPATPPPPVTGTATP